MAILCIRRRLHGHYPLPHAAPNTPEAPELSDFSTQQPRAQKRYAAIVHGARWLDGFHTATPTHRSLMLSQSQQGAMSAFSAVPVHHFRMTHMAFITAIQSRLRLPLSIMTGLTTCCCGAPLDVYGDHVLSNACGKFDRTPWHDLIQDHCMRMCRCARHRVAHDSRRNRGASVMYSPHCRPDFTLLHGAPNDTHIIVDVTTVCVGKPSSMPAASHTPLACALSAEADKHRKYGNVHPHVVLPLAVEHAGGLGAEAKKFFHSLVKKAKNELSEYEAGYETWSARGFSNYFLQSISVANLTGMFHYLSTSAGVIHAHRGAQYF